jgi:hypothetical protein
MWLMSDGNSIRVLRGGGWRIYPQNARVAHRLSVCKRLGVGGALAHRHQFSL